jgi:hypothetical protein
MQPHITRRKGVKFLNNNRKQSRVHKCITIIISCSFAFLVACSSQQDIDPETQFLLEIGAKTDPQVILGTNSMKYGPAQGGVIYWVLNRMTRPIYFPDQNLGVRIFKFDPIKKGWTRLPLGFYTANPYSVVIPPRTNAQQYVGGVPLENIPATGSVRLVVVGWVDPDNPEKSKVAAYADLEIEPH